MSSLVIQYLTDLIQAWWLCVCVFVSAALIKCRNTWLIQLELIFFSFWGITIKNKGFLFVFAYPVVFNLIILFLTLYLVAIFNQLFLLQKYRLFMNR